MKYLEWSFNKKNNFSFNNEKEFNLHLKDVKTDEIINFFNKYSDFFFQKKIIEFSKHNTKAFYYIATWCKKENLRRQIEISLQNNSKINFSPVGVVSHWMSGNIPTLGILSMILGLISRNFNIIKLSSNSFNTVYEFLEILKKIPFKKNLKEKILKSVLIFRFPRYDTEFSNMLSEISDARIIWGNNETISNISDYKKKLFTRDLKFGEKNSLIIFDLKFYNQNDSSSCEKIFKETTIFEQRACTCPHNILVISNSNKKFEIFISKLNRIFEKNLNETKNLRTNLSEIMKMRYLISKEGEIINKNNFSYTLIKSKKAKIFKPIYNNSLFVTKVRNKNQILKLISEENQTVGYNLKIDKNFSNELISKGVTRIVPIGNMSNFETVWDGESILSQISRHSIIS